MSDFYNENPLEGSELYTYQDFKLAPVLGAVAGSLVLLTGIGWLFGDPHAEPEKATAAGSQNPLMRPQQNPYAPQGSDPLGHVNRQQLSRMSHEDRVASEFAQSMQQTGEAMQRGAFPYAIRFASEAIRVASADDPDSRMTAQGYMTRARVHMMTGNQQAHIDDLSRAIHILRGIPDLPVEELEAVAARVDTIVHYYTRRSEYEASVEYANASAELRHQIVSKAPNPTVMQYEQYGAANASVGIVYSRLGLFSKAEPAYLISLNMFAEHSPTSGNFAKTIQFYSSCLHQQGKTDFALAELDRYYEKVQNEEGITRVLTELLRRGAELSFTIDMWGDVQDRLSRAEALEEEAGLTISNKHLCELASLNWELGNEEKALAYEKRIAASEIGDFSDLPAARSALFCTLEQAYTRERFLMELRVNRTKPARKEGASVETSEEIVRKLTGCFIDISLQSPIEDEPPITWEYEVTTPASFEIEHAVETFVPSKWSKLHIKIYEDSTREKKIGEHHQLVYSIPSNTGLGHGRA